MFARPRPREEVGHLARVEDVVDVLDERLVLDLRVGEQEDGRLPLLARRAQQLLEVVAPRALVVVLASSRSGRRRTPRRAPRARERLAARAADADEERVAARLLDDARDAADVLDRVGKSTSSIGFVDRRL